MTYVFITFLEHTNLFFYLLLWKKKYLCVTVRMFSRIIIFLHQVNYCKSKGRFLIAYKTWGGNTLKGLRLYTGWLLIYQCYLKDIYFRVKCGDLGFLGFNQMICENLKIMVLFTDFQKIVYSWFHLNWLCVREYNFIHYEEYSFVMFIK